MFKEIVEVVKVEPDNIWIKFKKTSSCSHCTASEVCGKTEREIVIDNPKELNLKPGDKIEVGIEEKITFFITFLTFFIPTLIFIIALVIFKNKPAGVGFLWALVLMTFYYIFLRNFVASKRKEFSLRVLRKL